MAIATKTRKRSPKPGRPSKYPWSEWTDGNWWQLTGFSASEIRRVREAGWKLAQRRNLEVETEVDGGTLYLRFKKQPARRGSR